MVESLRVPIDGHTACEVSRKARYDVHYWKKILIKVIHFYPYKSSYRHQLLEGDTQLRIYFILNGFISNGDEWWLLMPILWNNHINFHMTAAEIIHSCRIQTSKPKYVIHEISLYFPIINLLCNITRSLIFGP